MFARIAMFQDASVKFRIESRFCLMFFSSVSSLNSFFNIWNRFGFSQSFVDFEVTNTQKKSEENKDLYA